jgi:diketogulonate reductase-like aldo/keto reductase
VIPKSSNPDRIRQNLDVSDFSLPTLQHLTSIYLSTLTQLITLSESDFESLQNVHKEPGKLKHVGEMGHGDWPADHLTVGWTQEEMGWLPKN